MRGPAGKGITPSQTVGPFFKYGLTPEGKYEWNDAFTSNLVTADTSGERIRVEGRVLDGDGQPVGDCMLEIWQADAQGRFSDAQDQRALPNSAFRGLAAAAPIRTAIMRSTPSSLARCPMPTASRRRRICC